MIKKGIIILAMFKSVVCLSTEVKDVHGLWISTNGIILNFLDKRIENNLELGTINYELKKDFLKIKLDKILLRKYEESHSYLPTSKGKLKYKILNVTKDSLCLLACNKFSDAIFFRSRRSKRTPIHFTKFVKTDYQPSNFDSIIFNYKELEGDSRINFQLLINSNDNILIRDSIIISNININLRKQFNKELNNIFNETFNKYYFHYKNSKLVVLKIYVKNLCYSIAGELNSFPLSIIKYILALKNCFLTLALKDINK